MNTLFKPYGASVIGPTHLKKNKPNQDAFGYENLNNGIQIIAVSDGHGGELHCHSERGSKIAVDVALSLCKAYFMNWDASTPIESIEFDLDENLAMAIHEAWLQRIQLEAEFEDKTQFGCTLLVAIRTENRLFFLQLGDGKIATIYEDGVVYFPIPKDDYASTHLTNSLAQDRAWLFMKSFSMALEESIHMVVLATDGVENAYPYDYYDDANFYLNLAKLDDIEQKLPEMLLNVACFSKDDCTVVLWKNVKNVMLDEMTLKADPNELVVWTGENPLPYKTLGALSETTLNKKIEMAILMVEAFKRNAWLVPRHLTLKRMVYDTEDHLVDWIGSSETVKLTDARLNEWIVQWIGDSVDGLTCENAKDRLMNLQIKLRYDYGEQFFYYSDGTEDHKLTLETSIGRFETFHNSSLHLHQMLVLFGDHNPLVGSVTQHEKHPKIWGIINKTQHTWQAFGSAQNEIPPGKTLTLKHGVTFFAFGLPIRIIMK